MARVLFVISEDWALVSHRLHLMEAAIEAGYQVAIATNVDRFGDFLLSKNVSLYDWPVKRGSLNIVTELKTIFLLLKILSDFKPDLINSVALKPVLYSGLICKIYMNSKFFGTLGGLGSIFHSSSIKKKSLRIVIILLLKFVFNKSDFKLALQNIDNINHLKKFNIFRDEQLSLIRGSGVETKKFIPGKNSNSVPIIILPGRLLWDKGVAEFIKISERFKSKGIKARFVLIGDPDPENLESVSNYQIESWVKMGVVEHWKRQEHMEKIYLQANIVCLPSYHEGLPKVLLEACSCARPVVAFDVPGCRDIVRNDVNGKLVPFGDLNALESSLLEILSNPDFAKKMGLAGRKIVLSEFSDLIINQKILTIWSEMLNCNDKENY